MAAPPRGLRQVYPRTPCVSRRVRLGSPRIPSRQEDPMSDVSRREWLAGAGGVGVAGAAGGGGEAPGRGPGGGPAPRGEGGGALRPSVPWGGEAPGGGPQPPPSVPPQPD